jgi:hypothetical protein
MLCKESVFCVLKICGKQYVGDSARIERSYPIFIFNVPPFPTTGPCFFFLHKSTLPRPLIHGLKPFEYVFEFAKKIDYEVAIFVTAVSMTPL